VQEIEEARLKGIITEYIDDEKLKTMTFEFLKKYWSKYHAIKASKSGKYHHPVEQTEVYGTVNHTLRVLYLASELYREEFTIDDVKNDYEKDCLLTAALIHDVGKINFYKNGFSYVKCDHSVDGANMAKEFGFPDKICELVLTHMHAWDEHSVDSCKCENNVKLARILAYSDYLASKKTIDIPSVRPFQDNIIDKFSQLCPPQ